MTKFLDLHTHEPYPARNAYRIINLDLGKTPAHQPEGQFSCGIHPWYADQASPDRFKHLEQLAALPQAKMIGECGLDKLRGPSLAVQIAVLEKQVRLAEELRKPLLLHCVRAFSELIEIKNRLKISVPAIIHGFNKKTELAAQLEAHGFLLSVGAAVCRSGSGAARYAATATGPFFLETDDAGQEIAAVYKAVADLRKISVEALKDLIFAHWKKYSLIDV
ncbi:TatD family hydrolase [Pedobacter sp. SYP-B3415]|uniref:TatD family hydrolase n=1 Tax=Pedobacter sp. SYP-B3415 TaxID=2496641 RepID=UPI00101CF75A|nr:TatD family hydrolase [Pedobacter sp. SYP-B3415]